MRILATLPAAILGVIIWNMLDLSLVWILIECIIIAIPYAIYTIIKERRL